MIILSEEKSNRGAWHDRYRVETCPEFEIRQRGLNCSTESCRGCYAAEEAWQGRAKPETRSTRLIRKSCANSRGSLFKPHKARSSMPLTCPPAFLRHFVPREPSFLEKEKLGLVLLKPLSSYRGSDAPDTRKLRINVFNDARMKNVLVPRLLTHSCIFMNFSNERNRDYFIFFFF